MFVLANPSNSEEEHTDTRRHVRLLDQIEDASEIEILNQLVGSLKKQGFKHVTNLIQRVRIDKLADVVEEELTVLESDRKTNEM